MVTMLQFYKTTRYLVVITVVVYLVIYSRRLLYINPTRITGTLHEDLCTFVIYH